LDEVSSKNKAPTPKDKVPTPKHAEAPKDQAPERKAPKDKAPKDKAPKDKAPKDKAPTAPPATKRKLPPAPSSPARQRKVIRAKAVSGEIKWAGHKYSVGRRVHVQITSRGSTKWLTIAALGTFTYVLVLSLCFFLNLFH
jgi:hypothetical protein